MIIDEKTYIKHFGVKGMHWGQRHDREGVSRKTDREARKDAEEHARAKMYYGKGAGIRRKLINNSVEAKKKRDPSYAQAFDRHLARQDLADHASGARTERSRTDRRERTRQRAGAVARNVTGEMGTQAAIVAVVAGGVAFTRSERGRAMMRTSVSTIGNAVNSVRQRMGAAHINDILRTMG